MGTVGRGAWGMVGTGRPPLGAGTWLPGASGDATLKPDPCGTGAPGFDGKPMEGRGRPPFALGPTIGMATTLPAATTIAAIATATRKRECPDKEERCNSVAPVLIGRLRCVVRRRDIVQSYGRVALSGTPISSGTTLDVALPIRSQLPFGGADELTDANAERLRDAPDGD